MIEAFGPRILDTGRKVLGGVLVLASVHRILKRRSEEGDEGLRHPLVARGIVPLLLLWAVARPVLSQEEPSQLTSPPALLDHVEPVYPPDEEAAGIEATVLLKIFVDALGEVTEVGVVESGGAAFDSAAVEAAQQCRFSPAYLGEQPVPVAVTFEVVFALAPSTSAEMPDVNASENLCGRVRARGTRDAIPAATVLLEGQGLETLADADGAFCFRGVQSGYHTVRVRAPGYEPLRSEEEVVEGLRTDVVYFLRPSPVGANRTVVRVRKERKEVSHTELVAEEIRRIPGSLGDPIKAVQNLPGVARAPYDLGVLVVRGSGPEDTGQYVDGVRVPMLFHFGALRSVISPVMIEAVDFYPGGYGVAWGRTTGGAMDVQTLGRWPEHVHGLARIDLVDAEAAIIGPFQRKDGEGVGGFGVAGRRSYLDLLAPALAPPTVDLSQTVVPRWWDAQLKLTVDPSPRVHLWATVFGSDDQGGLASGDEDVDDPIEASDYTGAHTSFFRATVGGRARAHERVDLNWRLGYSRDAINSSLGSGAGVATLSDLVHGRLETRWTISPWLETHAGVDYIGGNDRFQVTAELMDQLLGYTPNEEGHSLVEGTAIGHAPAIYLAAELSPVGDRLLLIPGIRYDLFGLAQGTAIHTLDPRLCARLKVHHNTVLKGSLGSYHQPPQIWEVFDELGNPKLGAERSVQAVVGLEQRFTPFLSLDVQVFYKRMSDLIVLLLNDPNADEVWHNGGSGRVLGGEVFLHWRPEHGFFGWISYTLSRSTRQDLPGQEWYVYEFDQTHILDVVASYQLPFRFRLGGRFRFVSGNPSSPMEGAWHDVDENSHVGVRGEYNSIRRPSFVQLDLRLDKEFLLKRWSLTMYLEIINVLNRQNPEAEIYNFDFTEMAYVSSIPFIPNIGLQAEF